jgi:hypothetical protein
VVVSFVRLVNSKVPKRLCAFCIVPFLRAWRLYSIFEEAVDGASHRDSMQCSVGKDFGLGEEMRGYYAEEFAGCDDFGPFPISRKVPYIPRDEIVRTGSIRAFQKHIVVRIGCDLEMAHRATQTSVLL